MNPALLAPRALLRDTAVTGVLLTGLGALLGQGDAVGLGAAAGMVNLLAWIWAASPPERGQIAARIVGKQLVAPLMVLPLCVLFHPLPVMLGFSSLLVAVSAHAFLSVLRAPAESA